MKKVLFTAAALIVLFGITGCVVGASSKSKKVSRDFQVGGFEKISLTGNFDVYYSQGDSVSVRAEGDEGLIGALQVVSDGTTLSVSQKPYRLSLSSFRGGVSIYVSSPDLTGVDLTGNGDFEASGLVDTDVLDLSLTGNGDIEFEKVVCDKIFLSVTGNGDISVNHLVAGTASVDVTGNGDVKLVGRVGKLDKHVLGNGDVEFEELKAD